MLPSDHSRIEDYTNQNNSIRSDLQSLQDLRELLPQRPPVSVVDNYTIRSQEQRSEREKSWHSKDDEQGKQLMLKVIAQTHEILRLKEQLYYYKTEFFRVSQLYNAQRDNHTKQSHKQLQLKDLIRDLEKIVQTEIKSKDDLKALLAAKDKQLQDLKKQNKKLKTTSVQIDLEAQRNLKEEVQQQAKVIMELMIKNQKILKINAFLKEELTIAEGKLVRIEEQAQDKTCGLLINNLERLKENRNLINHKESISISNWQSESQKRRLTSPYQGFDPLQRQETVKLNSNRELVRQSEQKPRKESKTIEKERMTVGLTFQDKLRPLQEPKPYRKGYLGQLSKKYQRGKES